MMLHITTHHNKMASNDIQTPWSFCCSSCHISLHIHIPLGFRAEEKQLKEPSAFLPSKWMGFMKICELQWMMGGFQSHYNYNTWLNIQIYLQCGFDGKFLTL
jgi:hypothetical protein